MVSVAEKRMIRAQESVECLNISRHNLKNGVLLDLGCGGGWTTEYYFKCGIETVGLDIHSRLNDVKSRVPALELLRADGLRLPFKSKVFHTIILMDVLEHIPYKFADKLLSEIKRTLEDNGVLYVSVANKYQLFEPHTNIPLLTWLPRLNFIYYPYTRKKLKELCQRHFARFEDFTWFYALRKIQNPKYVGNKILSIIVGVLKKMKLTQLAYPIAERISVILFVCKKR
jgi:SAM-dependent methyltransferase